MTTQYILKNNDGTFYFKDKEMTIRHREDGPAIEYANGKKEWYLQGSKYCETEHQKLTGKVPTISIEGKTFTLEELKELIRKATF